MGDGPRRRKFESYESIKRSTINGIESIMLTLKDSLPRTQKEDHTYPSHLSIHINE